MPFVVVNDEDIAIHGPDVPEAELVSGSGEEMESSLCQGFGDRDPFPFEPPFVAVDRVLY